MAGGANRLSIRRVVLRLVVLVAFGIWVMGRLMPDSLAPWIGPEAARLAPLVVTLCLDTVAYAALLLWFARSLRSGHEPLITGFARRVRPTMPPRVVRYTRRVTLAWSLFFAAHLTVSAALLVAAPSDVWLAFVTLFNLPMLAAMMLCEFACRKILFRDEQPTSLGATLAALRDRRFLRDAP